MVVGGLCECYKPDRFAFGTLPVGKGVLLPAKGAGGDEGRASGEDSYDGSGTPVPISAEPGVLEGQHYVGEG